MVIILISSLTFDYTDLCLVGPAEKDDGGHDDEAEEDGEDEAADASRRSLVRVPTSTSQGLRAQG